MADAQSGLHVLRIRERALEAAHGLDGDADDRVGLRVQPARIDQVAVNHRVEIAVVLDVVDVPVDVVVLPACRDGLEMAVAVARFDLLAIGHHTASASASRVRSGCSTIIRCPAFASVTTRPSWNFVASSRALAGAVMRSISPAMTRTGQVTF